MRISDWSSDVCSSDLIFFPAEQRFLDQPRGRGRCLKAASDDLDKLIASIGNAATGPAQSEGRTNNGGKSRMIQRGNGLFQRMRNARTCGFEADFVHRIAEFQAILGLVDSLGIRADHLTTIFFQRSEEQTSELQSLLRISFA